MVQLQKQGKADVPAQPGRQEELPVTQPLCSVVLLCLVTKSCPTLLQPMDCSLWGAVCLYPLCLSVPLSIQSVSTPSDKSFCLWDFPGKNSGAGCRFLLQGIFQIQGSPFPSQCLCLSSWLGWCQLIAGNTESCPVLGLPALWTLRGGSVLPVTSKVWAKLHIPRPHPQGMEPGSPPPALAGGFFTG